MVLPFAGGASPPFPVVSLLFLVCYPQPRRSYYLFFNYLFFNYLYGGQVSAENSLEEGTGFSGKLPGGGTGFSVETYPEITAACGNFAEIAAYRKPPGMSFGIPGTPKKSGRDRTDTVGPRFAPLEGLS